MIRILLVLGVSFLAFTARAGESFLDKLPKLECASANTERRHFEVTVIADEKAGYARVSEPRNFEFPTAEFLVHKRQLRGEELIFVDVETESNRFFINVETNKPVIEDPTKLHASFSAYDKEEKRSVGGKLTCRVPPAIKPWGGWKYSQPALKIDFHCRTPKLYVPWSENAQEGVSYFVFVGTGANGVPTAKISVGGDGVWTYDVREFPLETLTPVLTDGFQTFQDRETHGAAFRLVARPPAENANHEHEREGDPGAGIGYFRAQYREDLSAGERSFRERLGKERFNLPTFEERKLKGDLRCFVTEKE